MPEIPDWKEKYRLSVLETEAEEARWRHIEKVLRRLVNRLCAAGMGANAQLDDELAAIAAANRRQADVTELESLARSLTTAVTTVESIALDAAVTANLALNPPRRWQATCTAVRALLERLAKDEGQNPLVVGLAADLSRATTDSALAEVLKRMADLVHERSQRVAQERQQAAAVLANVNQRLVEIVQYVTTTAVESRANLANTQSFDATVMSRVRELSAELQSATEFGSLQTLVGKGLESLSQCVHDYRSAAEARLLEQTARADQMRTRVVALEQETHDLHERLDQEMDRARIDPLTGVANRKAFDERIAHEIARRMNTDGSVALLVWDIDSFKAINDSYGHRAGDRVLQSVAKCFATAVRSTDFVARIGGEEFAMIMIGLPVETAVRMANELREAVHGLRFHFRGTPIRVTVSCGITEILPRETAETAFDRADAALYRAKNGGRNLCIAG